ncbi:hypothetical protein M9H77_08173 [Catharanthus roseus]|uniref:Uncharacterized protein n=1 Tax=Catharanthus roseus TaxID=4058 RepID=A0ACC0BXB9_CATRO|nr:hypothetical protein M9H77_08173 [Catharanthus roseus]
MQQHRLVTTSSYQTVIKTEPNYYYKNLFTITDQNKKGSKMRKIETYSTTFQFFAFSAFPVSNPSNGSSASSALASTMNDCPTCSTGEEQDESLSNRWPQKKLSVSLSKKRPFLFTAVTYTVTRGLACTDEQVRVPKGRTENDQTDCSKKEREKTEGQREQEAAAAQQSEK